jgi:hypothetical protein
MLIEASSARDMPEKYLISLDLIEPGEFYLRRSISL